jgi:hypothetical protein
MIVPTVKLIEHGGSHAKAQIEFGKKSFAPQSFHRASQNSTRKQTGEHAHRGALATAEGATGEASRVYPCDASGGGECTAGRRVQRAIEKRPMQVFLIAGDGSRGARIAFFDIPEVPLVAVIFFAQRCAIRRTVAHAVQEHLAIVGPKHGRLSCDEHSDWWRDRKLYRQPRDQRRLMCRNTCTMGRRPMLREDRRSYVHGAPRRIRSVVETRSFGFAEHRCAQDRIKMDPNALTCFQTASSCS